MKAKAKNITPERRAHRPTHNKKGVCTIAEAAVIPFNSIDGIAAMPKAKRQEGARNLCMNAASAVSIAVEILARGKDELLREFANTPAAVNEMPKLYEIFAEARKDLSTVDDLLAAGEARVLVLTASLVSRQPATGRKIRRAAWRAA